LFHTYKKSDIAHFLIAFGLNKKEKEKITVAGERKPLMSVAKGE
jgi:hypothetical protein